MSGILFGVSFDLEFAVDCLVLLFSVCGLVWLYAFVVVGVLCCVTCVVHCLTVVV